MSSERHGAATLKVSPRRLSRARNCTARGLVAAAADPARRLLMNSSEIAKVLNSTEDAHIKDMSTFETEEHLRVTQARLILSIMREGSLTRSNGILSGINETRCAE